MGTINFMTSNYITMGIKPYDTGDFYNDPEYMEQIEKYGESWLYDEIEELYNCDKLNTESILNKYNFDYFTIIIEPGYYESFSLKIEQKRDIDFYTDKIAAQKEITHLKECLFELAGVGLVACFPGWCTGYSDYTETIKKYIPEAIKAMRKEIKETQTYNQWVKEKRKKVI